LNDALTDWQRAILAVLSEDSGLLTRRVRLRAKLPIRNRTPRVISAWIRNDLLALQKMGYVRLMDDQKPDVWLRTASGTAALGKVEL